MKIIDLLNKIANGEEVPNKVIDKTRGILIESTEEYDLYDKLYEEDIYINDEVEILEEEKKIPEKLDIIQEKNIKNNWKWKVYGKEHSYNISTPQKIIAEKINQVIDYLESKGE